MKIAYILALIRLVLIRLCTLTSNSYTPCSSYTSSDILSYAIEYNFSHPCSSSPHPLLLPTPSLGQHMNGDEAMAMGAAFRAANLSTAFRVRKVGWLICRIHSPSCLSSKHPLSKNHTNLWNFLIHMPPQPPPPLLSMYHLLVSTNLPPPHTHILCIIYSSLS